MDANGAPSTTAGEKAKVDIRNLSFYYGGAKALKNVTVPLIDRKVTALIGPSGCGKSTLLRSVNRLNDLIDTVRIEGDMLLNGDSIYENIAFGIRLYERLSRAEVDNRVEEALRRAALWDEVKDKLSQSGQSLSGGQQQRLCIARGIAIKPEVLLLDEPCSALDPISTAKVEELIHELKTDYTVVIVTHNMQQAARCSDYTAYMYLGDLIEFGPTSDLFMKPRKKDTEDYITGRFG